METVVLGNACPTRLTIPCSRPNACSTGPPCRGAPAGGADCGLANFWARCPFVWWIIHSIIQ